MKEITKEYLQAESDRYGTACNEADKEWSAAIDNQDKDECIEQSQIFHINLGAMKAISKIIKEIYT